MRLLLLIPSVLKTGVEASVAGDTHPLMDYYALADALRAMSPGATVDLVDFAALEKERHPLVRQAERRGGKDAALAALGFLRRGEYQAIFTNSESIGIPLALLLKTIPAGRRPRHVTIGHRLSTGKKRLFFQNLRAHRQIDKVFVYSTEQRDFALDSLGIPAERIERIEFHADARFYRPLPEVEEDPSQICAAGLEWRDYPTLIEAVRAQTDLKVRLAAASPWSKHVNETERGELPAHVEARRYDYNELRTLYAGSFAVAVPLYENDFQAGITTILEAMAMGKALIVTRTLGQGEVIIEGETGLYVATGDIDGWRVAIERLQTDAALRRRLGRNARIWLEEHATLSLWAQRIGAALLGKDTQQAR